MTLLPPGAEVSGWRSPRSVLNVVAFYASAVLNFLGSFYGRGLLRRWLRSGGRYAYWVLFVGDSTYGDVYRLRWARCLPLTSGSCSWGSSTAAPRLRDSAGDPPSAVHVPAFGTPSCV